MNNPTYPKLCQAENADSFSSFHVGCIEKMAKQSQK
jgi:hypothetical protein